MEFNNIHSRKDFTKIYEIIGGTKGGVGENDGFANNAKLKDTYLGKLINGLFKGIGWLWRKSKEFFAINKLNAQLVNELVRGVIIFCFENSIDLTTGEQKKASEELKGAEHKSEEEGEAGEVGEIAATEAAPEVTKLSKEEVQAEIDKLTKILNEDYNEISRKKSRIGMEKTTLKTLVARDLIIKKQKLIQKMESDLAAAKTSIKENEAELAKYKQMLAEIEGTSTKKPTVNLDPIKQSCKDKYQFDPEAENLSSEAQSLEAMSMTEFQNGFQRIRAKFILIGKKYSAVLKSGIKQITVKDVDTSKNIITYVDENGIENKISDTKILPADFPVFKDMKIKAENFLKKYANEYGTMTDEQKKKIEIIYMNYALLKAMKEKNTILESLEFEDFDSINEESLVRNVDSKVSTAGTVKIKPDEPQAGKVSLGKAAAMKLGDSATVGDILNKRDRQKFGDEPSLTESGSTLKDGEFKLDVHDVNLAEIEKTIQRLEKSNPESDVKLKVSTFVNPYNLKVIQISAEQLLAPRKNSEGETSDNSALRLRWNKEVTRTYAAFTNLMDIDKVNIIKEDFGANLNNKKTQELSKKFTDKTVAQQQTGKMVNNLPLNTKIVNFSVLKTGLWCYYSFIYKSELFNTAIAPVADAFKSGVGLFQIASCFKDVNNDTKQVTINDDFNKIFSSTNNDGSRSDIKKVNVYFLIKDGQNFPQNMKSMNFKIFVLNELIYNDGTSAIFIKKNSSEQKHNIQINDNLLSKFEKGKFIQNVETLLCSEFDATDFESWKAPFKLSDQPGTNYNDFQTGKRPIFLKDNKTMDLLQKLGQYLGK